MTPRRVGLMLLTFVLGVVLALGADKWWNDPGAATRSDEDYIAIARSVPEVFHAGTPKKVSVDRSGRLAVDFYFAHERIRVFIHPRTEQVDGVLRDPNSGIP